MIKHPKLKRDEVKVVWYFIFLYIIFSEHFLSRKFVSYISYCCYYHKKKQQSNVDICLYNIFIYLYIYVYVLYIILFLFKLSMFLLHTQISAIFKHSTLVFVWHSPSHIFTAYPLEIWLTISMLVPIFYSLVSNWNVIRDNVGQILKNIVKVISEKFLWHNVLFNN